MVVPPLETQDYIPAIANNQEASAILGPAAGFAPAYQTIGSRVHNAPAEYTGCTLVQARTQKSVANKFVPKQLLTK